MSSAPLPRLSIGRCAFGQGLFAQQRIRQAEPLVDFVGPIVTGERALAKADHSFNLLQVGPEEYIDLREPGVLVNHSCEPNAGVIDDTVLIALRDIAPGEEITYDYSTTMSENHETMECLCGTLSCRRKIGDFHDLPPLVKDRYLAARLVQRFIVREHCERQQRARPARNGFHVSPSINANRISEANVLDAAALLELDCA